MSDETPTPHRYGLWKFFHDEHGLTLTVSELDEIERQVLKSNDQDRVNEAARLRRQRLAGQTLHVE